LNVKFIKGDIRSIDLVNHVLEGEKVDTVLHFAAQSHVDNSFGNSFAFTQNNVEGTHTLLESVRLVGTVKKFVHVSTDEVYGESSFESNTSNTEHESLLTPTNPYSATKAGAEMLVMAYGRSYNLRYIITRGNNVYGPNQYPEKAIPKFIILASRGEKIAIHGNGLATRSYMHVEDAISAFEFIFIKGQCGHVYNIGAHEERTVLSVAQDICNILKVNPREIITHVRDRAFNDRRYFIDCSKLLALGWSQKKTWKVGLEETVRWYTTKNLFSYWGEYESSLNPHPMAFGARAITTISTSSDVEDANHALSSPVFLIYGKTGWIGGMLGRILAESNHVYYYGSARLHDRAAIEQDITRCRPTHIINAAGITGRPNVDWCETHKLEVVRTNVLGTLNLIDVAHLQSIHVTNFATGCIYTYDDEHPLNSGRGFTEEDAPNFRGSYYSNTKAMVEELIKEYDNVLQLRLRMPIDDDLQNSRNFVYKIANYAKVVDIPNSMTVLNELVPLAIEGAIRNLTGVYNFTNPGVISHNEVLELYKSYCHGEFKWENFSLEEQNKILTAPRSNNELDTEKLRRAFPGIMDIKSSLIKHVFEVNKVRKMRVPSSRTL
jgi:UDP-glucose 4,6-dehydratase